MSSKKPAQTPAGNAAANKKSRGFRNQEREKDELFEIAEDLC